MNNDTENVLVNLPEIKGKFEKSTELINETEFLNEVNYQIDLCKKLQKVNNYEILAKKLSFLLKKYSKEGNIMLIQNIIRADIFKIISETTSNLVQSLSINEDTNYLLCVIDLIKELNNVDERLFEKAKIQIFFRLADQVNNYVQKNLGNNLTKISVQKEKIKVFGYFNYFMMEKQNKNIDWIFFTQFSDYFLKMIYIIESEQIIDIFEDEISNSVKEIFEPFIIQLEQFIKKQNHLKIENLKNLSEALANIWNKYEFLNTLGLGVYLDKYQILLQELIFSLGKNMIQKYKKSFFNSLFENNSVTVLEKIFNHIFEFKKNVVDDFFLDVENNILEFINNYIRIMFETIDSKIKSKLKSLEIIVRLLNKRDIRIILKYLIPFKMIS